MATGKQVFEALKRLSPEQLEKELKVWLPGSTISLDTYQGACTVLVISQGKHADHLMVEGNLDEGSVLT